MYLKDGFENHGCFRRQIKKETPHSVYLKKFADYGQFFIEGSFSLNPLEAIKDIFHWTETSSGKMERGLRHKFPARFFVPAICSQIFWP